AHLVLAGRAEVLAGDPALLEHPADEAALAGVAARHRGGLVGADLLEREQAVQERGPLAVPQAHELEGALVEPEEELVPVLLVADGEGAGLLVRDQVLEDVGQRDRTDVAFDSHESSRFRRGRLSLAYGAGPCQESGPGCIAGASERYTAATERRPEEARMIRALLAAALVFAAAAPALALAQGAPRLPL